MLTDVEETAEQFIEWGDKMIAATEFWVEADGFARQALWSEWHTKLNWRSEGRGTGLQIGELDSRPVMLCLIWEWLNGRLVCFYEATSQVVDHAMIEKWLEKTCNGKRTHDDRPITCDANNFHHCLTGLQIKTT